MGFLIDSDVIIDHLNNKNDYLFSVVSQTKKDLFISVITWSEILYGIKKANNSNKNFKVFSKFITEMNIKVVEFSQIVANNFIDIKIDLEKKGKRLEDFDLIIGATALVKNFTLVSNDTKHFSRIPNLKLHPKTV